MTGEEPMDSKEWQEWRAARDELAIANERGDAWRDKFHADTNRIAELEDALREADHLLSEGWGFDDPPEGDWPRFQAWNATYRALLGSPETP